MLATDTFPVSHTHRVCKKAERLPFVALSLEHLALRFETFFCLLGARLPSPDIYIRSF